ncbi:MAG: thiamine pyrophosphate-dependent enzyme [Cyclobacteriaceae bacterium]|nr:thiamine pyrophosphate-dependent enzyme [Cyclobacteriaceae bacterium]
MKNTVAKEPIIEIPTILEDYKLAVVSREASLLGRKEVFMGKAKFGIFGDGKEVPQLALAHVFKNGDFRSGYYRDQTLMFAIGELTIQQYFAQLYAHTSLADEPASAGRLMNGHFATRMLDEEGQLKDLVNYKNSTADISSTAGQMPRLVGLGLASKYFRNNKELHQYTGLSNNGNEIAFGTIGNASTSEGMFFEAMNAIGVLQIPVIMSVWDDAFGISVGAEYHTTKQSISKALAGLQRTENEKGFEILTVKAWDYEGLINTYRKAEKFAREEHVPVLVHVTEATQPQGHSTSGSHERYKTKERLQWEVEHDCNLKMRQWILANEFSTEPELLAIEKEAKEYAKQAKKEAWKAFINEEKDAQATVSSLLSNLARATHSQKIENLKNELSSAINPLKLDAVKASKKALRIVRGQSLTEKQPLTEWLTAFETKANDDYGSHIFSESADAALKVEPVPAQYESDSEVVDGRQILQACFDNALARDPKVLAFGEDVGKIGDVNQAFAGLQDKYGKFRVDDTGIRETTIIGQGIGMALRGLRPIAEIQYLDYLVYALPTLTDDLATLQYRTKGGQKAPLIIRTRGHRLEGVWHSGSPMGMLLNSLKGIYLLVPRNMTKAAGMYNTMLASDDTALMIESLNGYRLKEKMPTNLADYKEPLGMPEVIREGEDVTIITYGSMCRIIMDAAQQLDEVGIFCEVIDVQTLMPFDVHHSILNSLKKTNRVVFADEDVPGGASAYMMQKVLEEQDAYQYLDSAPLTITSKEHRPAYGSDGDYFSKPNAEEVFDKVYTLMAEAEPDKFADIY